MKPNTSLKNSLLAFSIVPISVILMGCTTDIRDVELQAATISGPELPSHAVLLEGELTHINGCVVIESDGLVYLPVFYEEFLEIDNSTVTYKGDHRSLGGTVVVGGSSSEQGKYTHIRYVPETCPHNLFPWFVSDFG